MMDLALSIVAAVSLLGGGLTLLTWANPRIGVPAIGVTLILIGMFCVAALEVRQGG